MESLVKTSWVTPPYQIGGLDHLGVQAPCIQIYGDLLPGITNVTDRARYYSFYPWLFSQFELKGWRSQDEVIQMLRRAECLMTLIALHHAAGHDRDNTDHEAAMVGIDALSQAHKKIQQGDSLPLSDYACRDEHDGIRYFKNPYGGFAQYYFGALSGLKLLAGDSSSDARLLKETGLKLAGLFAQSVPGELFVNALIKDEVNANLLKVLAPFCFCHLKESGEEVEALVALMLEGWPALHPEGVPTEDELASSEIRSKSLAYFCLLANAASAHNIGFDVLAFRGMAYTQAAPSDTKLELPDGLTDCPLKWQVYQRNELLSVGLQGLLYTQLRAVELSSVRLMNTPALASWFWQQSIGAELLSDYQATTANELIRVMLAALPDFTDWKNDQHEIQCMYRVNLLSNKAGASREEVKAVLLDSLKIIAAIIGRPENAEGYGRYTFPDQYLDYYPVNLQSVLTDWPSLIKDKPVAEGMALFSQRYCLDAHLRVAMRKLRQQGKNTFRFEPGEIGIVIKATPRAANTTPRFKQAVRILMDLGLLERSDSLLNTTARGDTFIRNTV